MRIIQYSPTGRSCGTRASASSSVGIVHDIDTVRVFALCNQDTSFHVGQTILVKPYKKPEFYVMAGWISKKSADTIIYKATYGTMIKK